MGIRNSQGVPDVTSDRIREDFERIFNVHKYTVTRVRESSPKSNDFFNESTSSTETRTEIEISIQGTPDAINRLRYGIESPKGKMSAYAMYDVSILETDILEIFNKRFKINNLNNGIKNGSVGFQSFDLEYIDPSSSF